jgi:hypothetical protein
MNRKEKLEAPEANKNPFFQKGFLLGIKAENPLTVILNGKKSLRLEKNKKHFLCGYAEGIRRFMNEKGLLVLIGESLENLTYFPFLISYSQGLARTKPGTPETLFENKNPSDLYNDAEKEVDWKVAATGIEDIISTSGYVLGFRVGLAKDFDLKCGGIEVPGSNNQYETFVIGLTGNSLDLTQKTYLKKNWASDFDRDFAELEHNMIYQTGLKVWLCKQKLNPSLASKIFKPENLSAFKKLHDLS